jgi:thiol:disulfide interchange protein DsbA
MIARFVQPLWLIGVVLLMSVGGCSQAPQTEVSELAEQPIEFSYTLVKQVDEDDAQGKIRLINFFWYGCPHCNAFQEHLQPWLTEWGDKIQYRAVPVGLKPEWVDHARAFYAAQMLGGASRFHEAFYAAIHQQKLDLHSATQITQFAASLGFDAAEFIQAMNAQSTEAAILADNALVRRYGVNRTPSLVLGGKYLISPSTAGGYENMLDVVEGLIKQP